MRAHPKSIAKLKAKLKLLTSRSNGMGYERRKQILHETIRGWMGYFKLADMKSAIEDIDKWLRRRIRMCIWKAWKHPKTRVKNLIKCGIKPYWAHMWGNASKGCWAVAGAFMQNAATTQLLRRAGYPCLLDYYVQMHKM